MGCHTCHEDTINIADDLSIAPSGSPRKEKISFRSLTEQGLRLVFGSEAGQIL